jgi:hypothetical protein
MLTEADLQECRRTLDGEIGLFIVEDPVEARQLHERIEKLGCGKDFKVVSFEELEGVKARFNCETDAEAFVSLTEPQKYKLRYIRKTPEPGR